MRVRYHPEFPQDIKRYEAGYGHSPKRLVCVFAPRSSELLNALRWLKVLSAEG
jgi:hypothetical protein